MMMYRPVFLLNKEEGWTDNYPYTAPIPKVFRRFTCFVIAEDDETIRIGSGTITNDGIITAKHIFAFDFQKVDIVLYADDYHLVSVPVMEVNCETNRDIARLYAITPRYIRPCLIPQSQLTIEGSKFYAFGCPQGIFGLIWKPNVVSYDEDWIISLNMLIPGISGGGIYYRHKDDWYLVAVHSWGHTDYKTIYSARLV